MALYKRSEFKKGVYRPVNARKYAGKTSPVFRSSWELKFFQWCDHNDNVLEWVSEGVVVPYVSPLDRRKHRYYLDGALVLQEGSKRVKYLIEIKPASQTRPPKPSKKKKKSTILHESATWAVNQAKWESARKWAVRNGYKFIILTEKELGIGR